MNNAKIIFYTGTGGAARVAAAFEDSLTGQGCHTAKQQIHAAVAPDYSQSDLLVLIFATHAYNAPLPVYHWIEKAPRVDGTPALVISVSGGGDAGSNSNCRAGAIRRLEAKGYRVIYEDMFAMPNNWMHATPEPLALMLLQVLPEKADAIVKNVLSGKTRRTRPTLPGRILSRLGELEKKGAPKFGKKIKTLPACNGCGWCAEVCPAQNITITDGAPKFGNVCQLCFCCIYGCPQKALAPGSLKFAIIKQGFSIKALEEKLAVADLQAAEEMLNEPGHAWRGVKKYLRRKS